MNPRETDTVTEQISECNCSLAKQDGQDNYNLLTIGVLCVFTILEGHEGWTREQATGNWIQSNEDFIFAKEFSEQFPMGKPHSLPTKFNVVGEYDPKTLPEMMDLLKLVTANPQWMVIRAKPKAARRAIYRRKVNFETSNKSNIIAIDVDDFPLPDDISPFDIAAQGRYVLGILNSISEEMFPLDAGFIAHASSSAGIKSGIRLHMFFQTNIPVTQGQLKFTFSSINESSREKYNGVSIIDLAYYSAVQAHYFADPIFKAPFTDPFIKERVARLKYVSGGTIFMPDNVPDFESTKGEFKEEFYSLLDQIKGKRSTSDKVERIIGELEDAEDGVYLRIIPKLYHNALEEGIDLAWLEKEITPALSLYVAHKDNRRTIQEYFTNGRKQALKAFVNNSKREIPLNLKGVPIKQLDTNSAEQDRFLRLDKLPPEGSMTFVKSSLGTGKTTAIIKWLDSGMIDGGFLAITNTRALVSSNAKKFTSGQYNKSIDMLDFKRGGLTRMSSTIHSIHKFKGLVDKVDFVFIDEADAVMNDLLFAPVVKNRRQCIETLRDILLNAKHVILSDGDISAETVEAYGSLIDFDKPINFYNHHRRMLQGAQAYEFSDAESVWVAFQTSLEMGEKSIIVTDCGPAELGERGIALREATGCVVKEIHSNSTEDPDIRKILDYTNEELINQNVHGLLCSPSVTNGVDWNYFDNVFLLTLTPNQAPNMRFQALRRDRGAQTFYFYTDKSTSGFDAGSTQYNADEGWLDASQQSYARRRETESRNYASTLRYYLLDQGATIDIFTESWGKMESAADVYKEERVNAILSSLPDYTPLRHNDAYDAKLLLMSYYHIDKLSEVTRELAESFVEQKPNERAEFFHKVVDLLWPAIKKCTSVSVTPLAEALKKHKREFFLLTGQSAQAKYTRKYLGMMGIGKDLDLENIKDWYRTYCKIEGIQLHPDFMTEKERSLFEEASMDLRFDDE